MVRARPRFPGSAGGSPRYGDDVPTELHPPQALIDEILQGNCVAFLGAGFSAAARLPGWPQLLREVAAAAVEHDERNARLAEDIQPLLHREPKPTATDLDRAAQALDDRLVGVRFRELLAERLRHEETPTMRDRLRWIRGIPFRALLTVNLDGVLDPDDDEPRVIGPSTYRDVLRPAPRPWWESRFWGDEARGAPLIKLHGDAGSLRNIVFTRRDYRRLLYESPGYVSFLRSLLATRSVLYLGFSFTDQYLNELRSEVLALLFGAEEEVRPIAWAVVDSQDAVAVEHFRRHEAVQVLTFDPKREFDGEPQGYAPFDSFLNELHVRTNPVHRFGRRLAGRRVLWVDPNPTNNARLHDFLTVVAADESVGDEPLEIVNVPTHEAALAALDDGAFDLIITHWGSDNDTARALLRSLEPDKRAPVIVFASPKHATRRRREALHLGAFEYCWTWGQTIDALWRTLHVDPPGS